MATIARNRALDEVRRVKPLALEDMPDGFEPQAEEVDPLAARDRSERLTALMRCFAARRGKTPGRPGDGFCWSAVSDPKISANNGPKRIPAAAIGRRFNPQIRHKLDQPSLQDLSADSLRSSNPHKSCERRQRLFLNAVSSLGRFRTPASPCLAPPPQEAGVRNPSPNRPVRVERAGPASKLVSAELGRRVSPRHRIASLLVFNFHSSA